MCGIAGILDPTRTHPPDQLGRWVRTMCDALAHRGPDDQGVWVDPAGGVALGHRRLAVIEPNPAGHQPMVGASGSVLTFNGELYNYQELRESLEAAGHRFATRTDTEVLLAGLDRIGADFLGRMDGMFAFGHYDPVRRRLLLARDGFGEKPLYTGRTRDGLFAFASELDALARLPGFDPGITVEAVAEYLCFQYLPAPRAIYRAAAKLPPGHALWLEACGMERMFRHFDFTPAADPTGPARSLDDLADELEAILVDTLRTRLIADVPLGAFLSGGVDSSTVVALIRRRLDRPLRTFSIGFAGAADSEHEEARAIADRLGTEHTDLIVTPVMGAEGARIGALLDEPNGDSSCLPTHILSGLARTRVTVALSGDGGDELFGGYGRYLATLADQARRDGGDPAYACWRPGAAYYSTRLLVFPDAHLDALLGAVPAPLADRLARLRADLDAPGPLPLIHRLRAADARDYLPGAVLAKVDRMSMRHALEVRAPLLGRAVAAFAARLTGPDCARPGNGKPVLKTLARRYLPPDWIDRPKRGFGLPMRAWGEAQVFEATRALLRPGENRLADWLGQPALDGFLDRQRATPWMYQLWAVLVLESWLRHHPARPA